MFITAGCFFTSPWNITVNLTPCGILRWGYVFTIAKHQCITVCSFMFNLNSFFLYISSLGLPRPCQSPASSVFTFSFHFRYHLNHMFHSALSIFITARLQLYFLLSSLFPGPVVSMYPSNPFVFPVLSS